MPVINGTEGPDQLSSTDQMDEIFGLGGDDIITLDDYYANTGAGPEAFHGGDGNDLFVVRGLLFTALQYYYFNAAAGTYTITSAPITGGDLVDATFDGFERYDIRIESAAAGVTIDTANGDDIVDVKANGSVTVHTYGGNDSLYRTSSSGGLWYGGMGDDTYYVSSVSPSSLIELANEGVDTIIFSSNEQGLRSAELPANFERLFVNAGFENGMYNFRGNALDNEIGGGMQNDIIDLSDGGQDKAWGYGSNDHFYLWFNNAWGAGDIIDGGTGYDTVFLRGNYNTVLTGASLIDVEEVNMLQTFDYTIVATDSLLTAGANLLINAVALAVDDVFNFDASAETNGSFTIFSGRANDTLRTGAGNDFIEGGQGIDLMIGGGGNDVYVVDRAEDLVVEASGGGSDAIITSANYSLAVGQEVEAISARDQLATTAMNLVGNEFGQTLTGNNGANLLNGLEGIDVMIGLAGNDTYVVDRAEDQVLEAVGGGNDVIFTSVSYSLNSNQEIETLSTQTHAGTQAIDLVGNQLNNTLYGNNGTNLLNGVDGADTMIGLGGNDTYAIDNAGDLVVEQVGGGDDLVFTSISHTLTNGNEVETLSTVFHQGTTAIDLGGNDYANHLIGNYGNNYLNGGGGADVMTGLNGNDTYVVDNAGDQVEEAAGAGSDTVFSFVSYMLAANQEVEVLSTAFQGGAGAIDLTGNNLNQTIYGNAGANVLNGGAGTDALVGYGGADTFAFTTALGASNIDVLADMTSGSDKIALDDAIFTAIGGLGALDPNAFVTGSAAADGNDRIIYNATTGALFYDADGNGAGAMVQFATLAGAPALAASDFVVI